MLPDFARTPARAALSIAIVVAAACSEAQKTPFFDESTEGQGGSSTGGTSGTGTGGASAGTGPVGGSAGAEATGGTTGGGAGISGAAGVAAAAGSVVVGGTGSGGSGMGGGGVSGTDAGGSGGVGVDCSAIDPAAVAYEDHCYLLRTTPRIWTEARADCAADGAHLATISSAGRTEAEFLAENAFVWMLGMEAWIGATDGRQSNQTGNGTPYTWITGEPMTFHNWSVNQPNNVQSSCQENAPCPCGDMCWEHCGFLWDPADDDPGTWNDRHCEHLLPYVCEWDDPPM